MSGRAALGRNSPPRAAGSAAGLEAEADAGVWSSDPLVLGRNNVPGAEDVSSVPGTGSEAVAVAGVPSGVLSPSGAEPSSEGDAGSSADAFSGPDVGSVSRSHGSGRSQRAGSSGVSGCPAVCSMSACPSASSMFPGGRR
ncbi:hypothetical protein N7U49_01450 [Streptomyces sp. AD2-2]|nr:hypothetical protein N7U49_01450 [Streptomyces sp. AD2-2]